MALKKPFALRPAKEKAVPDCRHGGMDWNRLVLQGRSLQAEAL